MRFFRSIKSIVYLYLYRNTIYVKSIKWRSLLCIIFIIYTSQLFAQGGPFDDDNYITVFDESDLYIDSYKRPHSLFEDQTSISGISNLLGGIGTFSTRSGGNTKEANGAPPPPPPPDQPINKGLFILMLTGILIAGYSLKNKIVFKRI